MTNNSMAQKGAQLKPGVGRGIYPPPDWINPSYRLPGLQLRLQSLDSLPELCLAHPRLFALVLELVSVLAGLKCGHV